MNNPTLAPDVATRRFTVDEVMQMLESGILGGDELFELIDGKLVVVSPKGRFSRFR